MSYIEKEPIIEFITKGLNNPDKTKAFGYDAIEILTEIEYAPTADVVPKSEVEEIIGKFECFLCHVTGSRLSKYTYDLRTMETVATDCINETYNDGFGEGYKECAREIFEEIEEIFRLHTEGGYYLNGAWFPERLDLDTGDAIAELKKKYEAEASQNKN